MYERHTYNEMAYNLPIRKGKITLIMKFAEVFLSLFRCTLHRLDREFLISKLAAKLSGKTSMLSKKLAKDMLLMKNILKLRLEVTEYILRVSRYLELYQTTS